MTEKRKQKTEELEQELDEQELPCCEVNHHHTELLKQMQLEMPSEENLQDLAELYKIFGDYTRVRILYLLFESELCVCDIAELLNMTHSAISHQLRVLKAAKLVTYRKEGKAVYYSLSDDHVRMIINQGMEHINE